MPRMTYVKSLWGDEYLHVREGSLMTKPAWQQWDAMKRWMHDRFLGTMLKQHNTRAGLERRIALLENNAGTHARGGRRLRQESR